jgi:hypothetical protein
MQAESDTRLMHAFIISDDDEGNFEFEVHGLGWAGLLQVRSLLEETGLLHVRSLLLRRLQLLELAGGEDFHDAKSPIQGPCSLLVSVHPRRYLPLPAEPAYILKPCAGNPHIISKSCSRGTCTTLVLPLHTSSNSISALTFPF